MYEAAKSGDSYTVEALLAKGTNPNTTNPDGVTPLMTASSRGHFEVAKLLLDHGANVNAKIEHALPNKENILGLTALMMSIKHPDIVNLLLERGADVNAQSVEGLAPLMAVCNGEDIATAEVLIQHGANVNLKGGPGQVTALNWAANRGNVAMIGCLVDHGAVVDSVTSNGWTPLMAAAHKGTSEACQTLLDRGADINHKEPTDGVNVFFAACAGGNEDTAFFFYEKGVDTTIPEKFVAINGMKYQILGDYFLAGDEFDKAKDAYQRAISYYTKAAEDFKSDASVLAAKQFGVMLLLTFLPSRHI